MKMKLISTITAIAAILSAVSLPVGYAVDEARLNSTDYEKYLEDKGYTLYPDQSIFDMTHLEKCNRIYYFKDSDDVWERIRRVDLYDPVYYISFAGDPVPSAEPIPESDPVSEQLAEIFDQGYEVTIYKQPLDERSCIYGYMAKAKDGINDTDSSVREKFSKAAKIGELSDFTYKKAGAAVAMDRLDHTAVIDPEAFEITAGKLVEELNALFANANISFKHGVRKSGKIELTMSTPSVMEMSEILAAVQSIHDKYGITFAMQHLVGTDEEIFSAAIDVLNSTDGDANCDGKLSIADATAIMQSIGNPDKYALTAQGTFNADVYEAGGGLTGMDAVTVMEKCVNE